MADEVSALLPGMPYSVPHEQNGDTGQEQPQFPAKNTPRRDEREAEGARGGHFEAKSELQPPASSASCRSKEDTDARDALRELQEIKAKTMYQMLDEVQTTAGLKKVVYLTTSQAGMFDETNVHVLLDTFEMSETKLIIILMYTLGGLAMVRYGVPPGVKDEGVNWREYIYQNTQPCMAFATDSEGDDAEFRMEQFMSKVVVPLAAETNAIVVVTCYSCCSLGLAFGRAASLAKARYNGKLPFKSLTFASAQWLDGRIGKKDSFANELCEKLPRWKQGHQRIAHAMEVEFGKKVPDDRFDNVYDINPLLDNIIIVDGVKEGPHGEVLGVDDGPKCRLEDFILSALTSRLPSVAFRAMQCGVSSMPKPSILHLLEQSVPVLLLDVRKRKKLAVSNEAGGMRKGSIQVKDRGHMLAQAIELDTAVHEELQAVGRADNLDMSRMAFFLDAMFGDGDPDESEHLDGQVDEDEERLTQQPLHQIIRRWHSIQSGGGAGPSEELTERAVAYLVEAEMRANWFLLPESKKAGTDMRSFYEEWAQDERMLNYNIFTSKHIFTGNVNNIDAVRNTVSSLVRMDKLPKHNSLEACTVLLSLWCIFDVCDYNRGRYWLAAQLLFFLQAATAVATTTVTVVYLQSEAEEPFVVPFDKIVFVLALFSSLVAGVSAFLNPSTRWRLLQSEMDKLSSHAWRFRTRTGAYELDPADPKKPERLLREVVRGVRESIIVSSDVGETTYHRDYPAKVFKHGQFAPRDGADDKAKWSTGTGDPQDNHCSPLQPQLYIRYRVRPTIKEYQKQLPQLGRARTVLQALLMLGTAAAALLANVELSGYVAIISSITSGITAWLEFHNTESKITELNAAIMQLENLLMWWDSMTEIERAAQETINELVDLCEGWIAAARREKMPTAKDEGEKDADAQSKDKKSSVTH